MIVSAFKQFPEGRTNLLDHVRGGGGPAVPLERLIVALPGERAGAERRDHRWVHTERGRKNERIKKERVIVSQYFYALAVPLKVLHPLISPAVEAA